MVAPITTFCPWLWLWSGCHSDGSLGWSVTTYAKSGHLANLVSEWKKNHDLPPVQLILIRRKSAFIQYPQLTKKIIFAQYSPWWSIDSHKKVINMEGISSNGRETYSTNTWYLPRPNEVYGVEQLIHHWIKSLWVSTLDSPHKGPVTRNTFAFDRVKGM